jgi:uncharacterized protein YbjT (DUF2867 family)
MAGKILVLGANGTIGTALVAKLLAKGEAVKAASRTGRAVAGAEGVVFSYLETSTHAAAFDGVDRAFVMLPTGHVNSREMLLPVIEAAAARRVKVVLQTAFGVDADDAIPYRQVELALEKSGIPYVILRPNWFTDNFHTFWKAGLDQGRISLPAGEGKTSFVTVEDIADCAAAVLGGNAFDGRAFNLTGPEALSYAEAAQILTEVLGRPVVYEPSGDEAFIALLVAAGLPADYAAFLAMIFHPVREGWTAAVSDAVPLLTGHPARSVRDYALINRARLV